jgi:hypothetical protein
MYIKKGSSSRPRGNYNLYQNQNPSDSTSNTLTNKLYYNMALLPTRPLGKNGPMVTRLGFGAMGLGAFYGAAKPDAERLALLDKAYELGEWFWDTGAILPHFSTEFKSRIPILTATSRTIRRQRRTYRKMVRRKPRQAQGYLPRDKVLCADRERSANHRYES